MIDKLLFSMVVSLPLAKKLKELLGGGAPKSLFFYDGLNQGYGLCHRLEGDKIEAADVPAYTAGELAEMMPSMWGELLLGNAGNSLIAIYKKVGDSGDVFYEVVYNTTGKSPFVGKGERIDKTYIYHQEDDRYLANAMAKMLIYLLANEL